MFPGNWLQADFALEVWPYGPFQKKNQGPATKHQAGYNTCCWLFRRAPPPGNTLKARQDRFWSSNSKPFFFSHVSQNITFAERLDSILALKVIFHPGLDVNFHLTGPILSVCGVQDYVFHDWYLNKQNQTCKSILLIEHQNSSQLKFWRKRGLLSSWLIVHLLCIIWENTSPTEQVYPDNQTRKYAHEEVQKDRR